MNVEVAFARIITVPDPPNDLRPGSLARMAWTWDRVVEALGPDLARQVVSWVETHQPAREEVVPPPPDDAEPRSTGRTA